MQLLAKELIVSGVEVLLPSRVGSLQILKYKPKRFIKKIDFKTTQELYGEFNKGKAKGEKKFVFFKNRHTDGYRVRLHWSKQDRANFRNKRKWSFKFTRPNIRPNKYNKNNPEVSLVPYIMKNGIYHFHEK
jgi:hypothetical protein